MKYIFIFLTISMVLFISACGSSKKSSDQEKDTGPKYLTMPSGLKYLEIEEGTGAVPKYGQKVVVDLVGKVLNGKEFENTYKTRSPVEFVIGDGLAIQGLEEGVSTMKAGGKRMLLVPPDLGFGIRGAGDLIPPNATLIMEIELISIN